MTKESRRESYSGPKLKRDLRKVIYDSDIELLPKEVQEVYLRGGYHTLVGHVMSVFQSVKKLNEEEQAFFRNRLTRELIDFTSDAHWDKTAAFQLVDHFDSKAKYDDNIELSRLARMLAAAYVQNK